MRPCFAILMVLALVACSQKAEESDPCRGKGGDREVRGHGDDRGVLRVLTRCPNSAHWTSASTSWMKTSVHCVSPGFAPSRRCSSQTDREKTMRPALAAALAAIASCVTLSASAAQTPPELKEIAFVANAEAGTVALVDVAARSIWRDRHQSSACADERPRRHELCSGHRRVGGRPQAVRFTRLSRRCRGVRHCHAQMLWQRSLNTGRADHMTLTQDGRSLFVSALMDNRVYGFPLRPARLRAIW